MPRPPSIASCRSRRAGRRWSVLQPSADRPEEAELAVSPTSRAANVYLLAGERERRRADRGAAVLSRRWRVSISSPISAATAPRSSASRRPRHRPAPRRSCAGPGVELRFRPGDRVADLRGGRWELSGEPLALDLEEDDGRLRSESYPDALARLWSALAAPHCRRPGRSRRRSAMSASTGAPPRTSAAAATGPCIAATRWARCCSAAAARRAPTSASNGRLRDVASIVGRAFRGSRASCVGADWDGPGVGALG